nr:hypothetical protein [Phytohabitans suffuscus]
MTLLPARATTAIGMELCTTASGSRHSGPLPPGTPGRVGANAATIRAMPRRK